MVNGPFCSGCLQQSVGNRFISFSGAANSGLMLIGDSPWIEEIRAGLPFQGPSGRLLNSQLSRAGMQRDDVIVTNVMCCQPPYLGWAEKHPNAIIAREHCRPHFESLIAQLKPKCIVTLGAVAMGSVIGVSGINERQSYIHDTRYGIPAIPTYHPSHILQGNHKLTQCLYFALARAKAVIANNGSWSRTPTRYLIDPPIAEAREYLFSSTEDKLQWTTKPPIAGHVPSIPLLVIDLETPNSHKLDEGDLEDDPSYTIIRLSLSVAPNTALTVPWTEPYIGLVKEAVAGAAVIVVWNGDGFDLPRMSYNGMSWSGEVHDGMWMWHFLQSDMLKGLGFVTPFYTDMPPWKHMSGADLPYYSACDADATIRDYLGIRADLVSQGRWPRFVRHCIRVAEIFRRPHVGRIRIDTIAQASLKQRLIAERDEALHRLQSEVSDTIKKRKVRKLRPKPEDAADYTEVREPCPLCNTSQAAILQEIEEKL